MPRSNASKGPVALFRAREEAAGSAERLRQLGFAVACLPVVAVVPLAFTPRRTRYDAVIATSAKAFTTLVAMDRAAPLYVVGARTAQAAEADGWRLAATPAPNGGALVETLRDSVPSGADLLYLAGRDRKTVLESALAHRFALEIAEVYAAEARERWNPGEIRRLGACSIALHYSRRSAELAAELAKGGGVGAFFRKMAHICLSRDVANPLEAIGAELVRVAATPNEPALFATLVAVESLFPSHEASRI